MWNFKEGSLLRSINNLNRESLKYLLFGMIIILLFIYLFYGNLLAFSISFYFTLVILQMINNNYKFSDHFIIRISQKFIICALFSIIVLYIGMIILDKLDLIADINCDDDDLLVNVDNSNTSSNNSGNSTASASSNTNNTDSVTMKKDEIVITSKEAITEVANSLTNIGKDLIKETLPNLVDGFSTAAGAGAAAAATVTQVFGATSGLPLPSRVGAAAASAGAVGLATAVGIRVGSAIGRQAIMNDLSSGSNSNQDRIPSPTEGFINSLLEPSELPSPLVELLYYQYVFSCLMLFLILSILFICISWYLNTKNINIISRLLGNRFSFTNKVSGNMTNFNNKFYLIILIINISVLVFCILMQLYISNELLMNVDDYISVHNHIKNTVLV
jgi:hypothetical protein